MHWSIAGSGFCTIENLPCVGRCKPISIGALLSILVDVAVEQKKNPTMWNVRTRTSNDPQRTVVEHLPPSLLRYDRRSFRSGRLTTGMFSVCQQHTKRSGTLWQFCGPVCFTFVLHLLQPVAHRMDVGDAHYWARTGSSPTYNTLLAGPLYQFWES